MIYSRDLKVIIGILFFCGTALAEDWSHWRGPFMNGSSEEVNLPSTWSKTKNVAWVDDLPGPGSATPIISQGKVFISSTDKKSDDLLAFCFDAKTGKQLWKKRVAESKREAPNNNLAAPSPVTDGKYVYFMYGSGDLAGFDFEGKLIWSKNIEEDYGNISQKYGYSSSPLLYENKLYILVLRRDTSYRAPKGSNLYSFLLALNAANGEEIWKQTRKSDVQDESLDSYTSPILFQNGQQTEILNIGASLVTSNDAQTGQELWRYRYPENPKKKEMDRNITSLLAGEGLIYAIPPRGEMGLFAIKSGKKGTLTEEDILWRFNGPAPDCSTPLFYKGNVYVLADRTNGILTCLDAKTGKQKWQGELGGRDPWWASITASDDKLYCISEKAEVVVLAAGGNEFKIISRINMEDGPAQGSIAIADKRLYIHTASRLYCISN
jgi:outer membrane protein assembly factor BamB